MRYVFADCTLDTDLYALQRVDRPTLLRAKVFQVLHYLLTHRDRVVSKQELCERVWAGQFISDAAVEAVVKAVRQAVGDTGRRQWCIQTRRGHGYRFVAPVAALSPIPAAGPDASPPASERHSRHLVVAREGELAQLQEWWTEARQGTRQVVFVAGEIGIGKTAVVEAFVDGLARDGAVWIGHGQCVEQYGMGEAFLPLLEALGRLCRDPEGAGLIALLRQHAPSWLAQMPALLPQAEREALQRQASGVTRARMLRELAEAMERLTAERPLVLVLEDLHWSDASTLEWLAYVARQRDRARLLVLATHRPVGTLARPHPLTAITQELQQHDRCHVLRLPDLPPDAVALYLARRFAGASLPGELAPLIYRRTNGHPLFMVSLADDMAREGLGEGIEAWTARVPESLRQLIETQLTRLAPEDYALLEAASVAGVEWSAATVAAACGRDVDAVEERWGALVREHLFLQPRGTVEWPDGTLATRYGFRHALHQQVLYERVPPGRRARLHQRIGDRLETGLGPRARESAAELAMHFARGHDARRAAQYHHHAGENALRRGAHREAVAHLEQGLAQLASLPDSLERVRLELALQHTLGVTLMATKGYAAPEVVAAYGRARELCQQAGETSLLFSVLVGLWRFYFTQGALTTTRELTAELLRMARDAGDPALLLEARTSEAMVSFYLGELATARDSAAQGIGIYDVREHGSHALVYGQDPGTNCLSYAAWSLLLLGYPEQSRRKSDDMLALSEAVSHPLTRARALVMCAIFHYFRREPDAVRERIEAAMALATEKGFSYWLTHGPILQGWLKSREGRPDEAITRIREGLDGFLAMGAKLTRTWQLGLLATTCGSRERADEGLGILDEAFALVETNGERMYEAELHRLRGELLLRCSPDRQTEAESCFQRALTIARQQEARWWELRAATSLGRLWQAHGRRAHAHEIVSSVFSWFTEGFDMPDLRDARDLLAESTARPPRPRPYAPRR